MITSPVGHRAWKRAWSAAVVAAQAEHDRATEDALRSLDGLVRALAHGAPAVFQHYANMIERAGVGRTLLMAQRVYRAHYSPEEGTSL